MKPTRVHSITYLKANASEILRNLEEDAEPIVITQNGEAKMVVQNVHAYQRTQETLALLKALALGEKQIEEGKTEPALNVFDRLRDGLRDE